MTEANEDLELLRHKSAAWDKFIEMVKTNDRISIDRENGRTLCKWGLYLSDGYKGTFEKAFAFRPDLSALGRFINWRPVNDRSRT